MMAFLIYSIITTRRSNQIRPFTEKTLPGILSYQSLSFPLLHLSHPPYLIYLGFAFVEGNHNKNLGFVFFIFNIQ